jgi:hypothetical protein
MYVNLQNDKSELKLARIILIDINESLKDTWIFDWSTALKEENSVIYALRIIENEEIVGLLKLKNELGMLIMDLIEISSQNIGKAKKYINVAGILLAFACLESFKLNTNYKGYLTFVSKSNLIDFYKNKYGASVSFGQRMFFTPEAALNLIKKYLRIDTI